MSQKPIIAGFDRKYVGGAKFMIIFGISRFDYCCLIIIIDDSFWNHVIIQIQANKKKVVRSRYISTELGIRERLVSAIITERETVNTMAVAVNKTLAHHLQKLLFFFGANEQPFKGTFFYLM